MWEALLTIKLFQKHTINEMTVNLSRDELIRRSRILVVDDERPQLIDDLQKIRFAVDYLTDVTSKDLGDLADPLYDLLILDFGGVGSELGSQQGLSILQYVKRVNPAIVVFAYTSKAITAKDSEFFRTADGVLPKDAGVTESLEKIEGGLRKAQSPERIWRSVLAVAGVEPGSARDVEWQDLVVRGTKSERKERKLTDRIVSVVTSPTAQKVALGLVKKLIEIEAKRHGM